MLTYEFETLTGISCFTFFKQVQKKKKKSAVNYLCMNRFQDILV